MQWVDPAARSGAGQLLHLPEAGETGNLRAAPDWNRTSTMALVTCERQQIGGDRGALPGVFR